MTDPTGGRAMPLTTELRSFLLSRISCSIWFRCSIISVLSYVYAEMSLSCCVPHQVTGGHTRSPLKRHQHTPLADTRLKRLNHSKGDQDEY